MKSRLKAEHQVDPLPDERFLDEDPQTFCLMCRGLGDEALLVGKVHIRLVLNPGEVETRVVVVAAHAITLTPTVRVDRRDDGILETLLLDVVAESG